MQVYRVLLTTQLAQIYNFQFLRVNKVELETALQGLNSSKSDGWDGIPSMALKIGASELSIPLTTLYDVCISSCEWPAMWKRGDWVPVFKKDDPRLKKNYRPITMQATVN